MTMGGSRSFVVLVGDLVGSRALPERQAAQERLEAALEQVHRTARNAHESPIVVPPMITVGDEFQALLNRAGPTVDMMAQIRDAMWPIEVSCGVGRGAIATPLRKDAIGRMDGPAFHAAREAIGRAKPRRGTAFAGFEPQGDQVLFGLYQGLHAIARRWTERQVEVMRLVRRGGTQVEIAKALGVSQSVISQSLAASSYDEVRDIEHAARTLLDAIDGAKAHLFRPEVN